MEVLNDFSNSIQGAFGILLMIICIVGIIAVIIISIVKVPSKMLAVITAAVGCCILMIPVILGFNNFVASQVASGKDQKVRLETLMNQANKINDLEKKIRDLENSGFSLQSFSKILELALIETHLQQTVLTREVFDRSHRGLGAGGKYDWEYLGVLSNDLVAKFGIDLNLVKIYTTETDPNTLKIYGLASKYIGTAKSNPRTEISEVRKLILDIHELRKEKTEVDNSAAGLRQEKIQRDKMLSAYQDRLNKGLETAFMNETVVELGENFIKMILAPLNRPIEFTNIPDANATILSDFLSNEKKKLNEELNTEKSILEEERLKIETNS